MEFVIFLGAIYNPEWKLNGGSYSAGNGLAWLSATANAITYFPGYSGTTVALYLVTGTGTNTWLAGNSNNYPGKLIILYKQ